FLYLARNLERRNDWDAMGIWPAIRPVSSCHRFVVGIGAWCCAYGGGAIACGTAASPRLASFIRLSPRKRAHGCPEFLPRVLQPRSRADQRLCGCASREFAADRSRRSAGLRADVVYASRELVWDVGIGGGASG